MLKQLIAIAIFALVMAGLLVVILVRGLSLADRSRQAESTATQPPAQGASQSPEQDQQQGLRIDPLGKFTSPGRCVGLICM